MKQDLSKISDFDKLRLAFAGYAKAEYQISRSFPRYRKVVKAYDQALKLADAKVTDDHLAACRGVALRAAQDLNDRILGKPKEHIEHSGYVDLNPGQAFEERIDRLAERIRTGQMDALTHG